MAAGRSDLQRAARMHLATHVGEVGLFGARGRQGFGQWQRLAAVELRAHFQQRARGAGLDLARQRGLGTVAGGDDQLATRLRSGQRGRQDAIDRAQFAGEAELADEFVLVERLQRDLPARGEDAQGDGEVEAFGYGLVEAMDEPAAGGLGSKRPTRRTTLEGLRRVLRPRAVAFG